MKTLIVNHQLVKVMQSARGTEVHIKLLDGGWVEHYPFTPDLQGLVAAMALATDVIAGKVYLKSILSTENERGTEAPSKLIGAPSKTNGSM